MYFKILADDLTHNGFTYHAGLNKDTRLFSGLKKSDRGLFFTDEKNVCEYFDYGTKIAEIVIPERERVIKMNGEYKAHRIILREIKPLWKAKTFKWLKDCGVNLHEQCDHVLQYAAYKGYLEVVKFLTEDGADIHRFNEYALSCAANGGHLEVVKYLIDQGADIHADIGLLIGLSLPREYGDIHGSAMDREIVADYLRSIM